MMNKKKTGAYMGGGMAKKKPMAATGYKEGGTVKKKKETFGQAFKRNRKKFMESGKANDYTFKYEGKDYNVRQKGETEKGLLAKYVKSAPKKSVRPKTRPSAGVSENTKKKITSTVRDVMAVKALSEDGPDKTPRKTKPRVANSVRTARKGVSAGSFAGKGAGKDKPKAKPVAAPDRKMGRFSTDGKVMGSGQKARPGARLNPSPRKFVHDIYLGDSDKAKAAKAANSEKVRAGQAKYRDRAGPQRRVRDVTFAEWKRMSRAKKEMLGLPVSFLGGEIGFNRLLKGLTGADSTRKTK